MTTKWTTALKRQFEKLHGVDDADQALADFVQKFSLWKASFPRGEFAHYLFGRDTCYTRPPADRVDGEFWHVHLVPLGEPDSLARWNTAWERGLRRRTGSTRKSNRALVYATKKVGTQRHYLLIFILNSKAHEIARMQTDEHRILMGKLALIANRWLTDDKIVG